MAFLRKILKWSGVALVGLIVTVLIITFVQKQFVASATEARIAVGPEGVSFREKIMIGGAEQWIFARSQKKDNPVLLFIHGGPGFACSFLAHALNGGLEENFIVVNWDQRGAGKSFSPWQGTATLDREQYLTDTHQLVQYLKKRFNVRRIYLMGHSWGSWLGAVTAHRHPEDFIAYIGIGQMVNAVENEVVSYNFTLNAARRDGNMKAIAELEHIGPPPYEELRSMGIERDWLLYYGGAMFHGEHRHDSYEYLGRLMFASPDYTYTDMFKFFAGLAITLTAIYPEFYSLDLYTQAPAIDVPVYFMAGRHDYNTPWEIMLKYEKVLKAPRKTVIWFEKSAHAPNFEEPEAFADALLRVKRETYE